MLLVLATPVNGLLDAPAGLFLLTRRIPPTPTLFPYTTLFRSFSEDSTAASRRRGGSSRPRPPARRGRARDCRQSRARDRKSTRLNSSHANISYAVFCLKKKTTPPRDPCRAARRGSERCALRGR